MTRRKRVYVDTESGGLDDSKHPLLELAWAIEGGEVKTVRFPHDVRECDEFALQVNGYDERRLGDRKTWSSTMEIYRAWADMQGATLIMSNPSHDERFLLAYARTQPALMRGFTRGAPWHHRKINIADYAMPLLGYDEPQGLAKIVEDLNALGQGIPWPDHSAAGDVEALRAAFLALETVPGPPVKM